MLRNYFLFILVIGFFAAVLGHDRPAALPTPSAETSPRQPTSDQNAELANLNATSAPQFTSQDGSIELQRQPDGHFYADVRINGANVHMLVDTGATVIALSRNDAQMAGLATSISMNGVVGRGADGAVHGEVAHLDSVDLGPLHAQGLDAVVLNSGEQSLLGQSFLSRFGSVNIQGDKMVLR